MQKAGGRGPVLVDITKDVTAAVCEYVPAKPQTKEAAPSYSEEDLDRIADYINKAEKPYIYLGGGAVLSGASKEVAEFAELIDAPVCDTLMAKGLLTQKQTLHRHDRYARTKTSNLGVSQCDLLIALGARFSDRVIGNPKRFARKCENHTN